MLDSVDAVAEGLRSQGYVAGREVATQVYLAAGLGKPLLVEGPAGSGRTSLALAIARAGGAELLSVTCHPAIEPSEALYRWDSDKQLLHIREAEAARRSVERARTEAFGSRFLIPGPVLAAFQHEGSSPPILLVHDIDRAGEPFQIWLAQAVSELRVEVPGVGVVTARQRPLTFLTASETGTVAGALQRASLVLSLSYPEFEAEQEILASHVPGLSRALAGQAANFIGRLRRQPLRARPGLGESLDWARALVALRASSLTPEVVDHTLGCILKNPADIADFRAHKYVSMLSSRMDRSG